MGLGELARHLEKVKSISYITVYRWGKPGLKLRLVTGSVKDAEHSVSLPRISILAHPRGPVLRIYTPGLSEVLTPFTCCVGGIILREVTLHESSGARTGCEAAGQCTQPLLASVSRLDEFLFRSGCSTVE